MYLVQWFLVHSELYHHSHRLILEYFITLKRNPGTSLVVQWLRLCAPNTGVLGLIY